MPCDQELAETCKRKSATHQTSDVKRQRLSRQSCGEVADEPSHKHSDQFLDRVPVRDSEVGQTDSVNYWVGNNHEWSLFLRENTTMDDRQSVRSQKRSLFRSNSYRQSTISSDTPKAWGREDAAMMLESGIFMDRQEGATITEDDEILCKKILETQHDLPKEWRFQEENFLTVLRKALFKNKQRVLRDIGPHIMPSPELLSAQGHPGLEHIAEAVDAQWIKCTSLCGLKSRPDVSHGVSRFVFTPLEREKLTANNTAECEMIIFPFYICEAACFEISIEESELRALHSASVASNTVIELYQKISAAEELNQRILAFSVSHNQRLVKIFGHFVLINGSNITFHRHRLFEADLVNNATSRSRPYQIALSIWEHFYPIHLARIQSALSRRSGGSTPVSLPDDSGPIMQLQEDNTKLLNRLLEQQEEFQRNLERQSEQYKEMMERQSKQHREQVEQQKEQMERQSKQHREQVEQQNELITLLKQARS